MDKHCAGWGVREEKNQPCPLSLGKGSKEFYEGGRHTHQELERDSIAGLAPGPHLLVPSSLPSCKQASRGGRQLTDAPGVMAPLLAGYQSRCGMRGLERRFQGRAHLALFSFSFLFQKEGTLLSSSSHCPAEKGAQSHSEVSLLPRGAASTQGGRANGTVETRL